MPYPRVIPHSDAAGVIDAVGEGVDARRVGTRVWVYGAQSYRPFGTAAQYTVVPDDLAVDLPDHLPDELGASLGIPGITAHRTVFADGPVDGRPCWSTASSAASARWPPSSPAGPAPPSSAPSAAPRPATASIPAVVPCRRPRRRRPRRRDPRARARRRRPDHRGRPVRQRRPRRRRRRNGAVIAAYATRRDRPEIPFWPLLFDNVTLRLLGSDDFPAEAKRQAARDLTVPSRGALTVAVGDRSRWTASPMHTTASMREATNESSSRSTSETQATPAIAVPRLGKMLRTSASAVPDESSSSPGRRAPTPRAAAWQRSSPQLLDSNRLEINVRSMGMRASHAMARAPYPSGADRRRAADDQIG